MALLHHYPPINSHTLCKHRDLQPTPAAGASFTHYALPSLVTAHRSCSFFLYFSIISSFHHFRHNFWISRLDRICHCCSIIRIIKYVVKDKSAKLFMTYAVGKLETALNIISHYICYYLLCNIYKSIGSVPEQFVVQSVDVVELPHLSRE